MESKIQLDKEEVLNNAKKRLEDLYLELINELDKHKKDIMEFIEKEAKRLKENIIEALKA